MAAGGERDLPTDRLIDLVLIDISHSVNIEFDHRHTANRWKCMHFAIQPTGDITNEAPL